MSDKKKLKLKKKREEVEEISENELPIDVENEQYVLACVLNFKECRGPFLDEVSHKDFLVENHKAIAWTMIEAMRRERQITPEILQVIVSDYMGEKKFTGLKYLYELKQSQEEQPELENYRDHIGKLKADKIKNILYYVHGNNLINALRDPHSNVDQLNDSLDLARTYIESKTLLSNRGFQDLKQLDKQYEKATHDRTEGVEFQSTKYRDMDKHLTEGLARKRISIVAGRPGMCKSAFVDNMFLRLGQSKIPSAMFSLEMDGLSVYDRLIAIRTEIELKTLIRERKLMTDDQLQDEIKARSKLVDLPLYVYDKTSPQMDHILKQLKFVKETYGCKVAFVDLFSKIQKPWQLKGKSTADQIAHMLDQFQAAAKDLDMHICLVVQIGRKAELRKGKRPQLSDLKDSGAFEEVADLIFLLYRESYYITEENRRAQYFANTKGKDILEVLVAKQRQGAQNATVKFEFKGEITKIDPYRKDKKKKVLRRD